MWKLLKKLVTVLFLVNIYSCHERVPQQELVHNKLIGHIDCMYFASADTGYIVTHTGGLPSQERCTYLYQTSNGGVYWDVVDSIQGYCFQTPHALIYRDMICGYVDDGATSEGYRECHFCLLNVKSKSHTIHNEVIHGPGHIFCSRNCVCAYVFKGGSSFWLFYNLADEALSYGESLGYSIKDIASNDSSYAYLTYDNKLYVLFDGDEYVYDLAAELESICENNNYYYVSYLKDGDKYAGISRVSYLTNRCECVSYPRGYKFVKFLENPCDSKLITFAKKDYCDSYDVVYSVDDGVSWKIFSSCELLTLNPRYCSYCAPFLYVKTSNERIVRLLL